MIDDLPSAPLPNGVLEAALYAVDLDAAEAFYGGVLGLERVQRAGERHVFFRAGGTVVLVFNPNQTVHPSGNDDLPVPPHGAKGPGHLCFSTRPADLDLWLARFDATGVEIEADFRWPNGARSIYVRDPAGNSIEFAEPRLWED